MKTIKDLKVALANHEYEARLHEVYLGDALEVEKQEKRYEALLTRFESCFGESEVAIFSAPGRSEVSGNHTDHQCGKVLAASINLDAIAAVTPCNDTITIISEGFTIEPVDITDLTIRESEAGRSEALIRGVVARLKELGYKVGGFKAVMTSDVLSGSGLSSSAAFEVLVGTILSHLYNEGKIDSVLIAQVAQYAENKYFMKPCGLMDQCACSVGGFISIDFYDNAHPVARKLDFDFDSTGYQLCITDTKGDHANLTAEYAAVPAEMKAVAQILGQDVLSHCNESEFYERIAEIRTKVNDRAVLRAIHLFSENHRVDALNEALDKGDIQTFIELIKESGRSSFMYLQNIYANFEAQNQPVSVGLALSQHLLEGKGAYRVHGGGFAGTIQAFVKSEDVPEFKQAMENLYGEGSCYVLKIRNLGGIQVL